ncbi:MAG TPA: pyruvate kinase [Clostridiales bacterium]|nr:pyruvate kinase [Clostridiales bacterium]
MVRKTKIICTLGPKTDDENTLKKLMLAGINIARLNFSHESYDAHERRIKMVKKLRDQLNLPIAIMLDTKGPEIRIKTFENSKVFLEKGQKFVLTTEDIQGDNQRVSITYKKLPLCIQPGAMILLNDGLIELEVETIENNNIVCSVIEGGILTNNKSLNIPNCHINMPYLSKQDEEDLIFGVKQDVDYIAMSFVRSADDVKEVRNLLNRNGGEDIEIIAKIENREGVNNIDEILRYSDGIMIARGDMGVEIPFEQLPSIQKNIIKKCYRAAKKVITATQMLESMIHAPKPTRAEISDIANAVFDGTSAIMLSGETAIGDYPLHTVKTMASIASYAESTIEFKKHFNALEVNINNIADAVSHATCAAAMDLNATAILVVTQSGSTARMISSFRPAPPIIAVTTNQKVYHKLSLSWGVTPVLGVTQKNTDLLFAHAIDCAKKTGIVKKGDIVVITAGVPVGISGNTNILKIENVK